MTTGFTVLAPGATIGILGGGQLGRMLALAAGELGFKCHIFAPRGDNPAFAVAAAHTEADYADQQALQAFADSVDGATYEFENVPVEAIQFLETHIPVRPGSKALAIAQDRIQEKTLARSIGAKTAEFETVTSLAQLETAVGRIGFPSVLKTTRMGYDGKGQAKIAGPSDLQEAWAAMRNAPSILESFVRFDCEVSVIAARGADGSFQAYDVTENVHRNHILHTSTVPAAISTDLQAEAVDITKRLLQSLDYTGVAGVEFFVGGSTVYFNEIAPRVHNSGHWTQDACLASQFSQHIRAVAGWPLANPIRHSDVVMTNLLGAEAGDWGGFAREGQTGIHIYGKAEARPGRKMGHINRISPRREPR